MSEQPQIEATRMTAYANALEIMLDEITTLGWENDTFTPTEFVEIVSSIRQLQDIFLRMGE